MLTLKPKVIAEIQKVLGDRVTPHECELIADKTIQIVEEHYLNAAKVLVDNASVETIAKVTGSNDK